MGTSSLDLIFRLSADPAQATAALAQFRDMTGKSFEQVVGQTEPLNRALLSNRESTGLLTEELGIHLPRAVTGAIAEILPSIGAFSGALLGVFAVKEAYEFYGALKGLAEEFNETARAEKLMAEAGKENLSVLEEMARKSISYAQSQIALLNTGISVETQHVEELKKNVDWLAGAYGGAGMLVSKVLGQTKELRDAEDHLAATEHQRDSLVKILGKDEDEAQEKQKRARQEWLADLQAMHKAEGQQAEWRIRTMEQAGKQLERDEQERQKHIAQQQFINKLDLDFLKVVDDIGGASERNEKIFRELGETISAAFTVKPGPSEQQIRVVYHDLLQLQPQLTNAERQETAARLAAIPAIQEQIISLSELKGAHKELADAIREELGLGPQYTGFMTSFTQAAKEQVEAVRQNMAASVEGLSAGLAGLIGGRRAQAAVEMVWEIARGIACLGEGTWPPNPAAIIAAGLHFESAAQYGILAGKSSHHRAGAGAGSGTSSGREGSYGRSGAGRGSYPPQTLAPGAAGGGRFSGAGLTVMVVGDHEAGQWIAGTLNRAVDRGVNLTATSSMRGSPVGH